jgi:hypothetical protein
LAGPGQAAQEPNETLKQRGLSGNPVFRGWYADPEAIVYGSTCWIYPTWSDDYGEAMSDAPASSRALLTARQRKAVNPQYLKQTYFDAFSSEDLVRWTKHPRVLDVKDVPWAEFALWAPSAIRANGRCHLMWSEGGWTGPNYSVAYAISDSPAGPFTRIGKVLQQNPAVATGAGHHSVIPVPGSDTWYIVYHRRPLGTKNGNHREVCIDEMRFNPDGTIQPVTITFEGVRSRRVEDR